MNYAIEILEEQKKLLSDELKEIFNRKLERQETVERLRDVTNALDNLTSSSRIIHSQPHEGYYYWIKHKEDSQYEVAYCWGHPDEGLHFSFHTKNVKVHNVSHWKRTPIPQADEAYYG